MLQLIFIKPSGRLSQNCLTLQNKRAVCLHLELVFETLVEEMKLDTDALEETFAL